MGVPGWVQDAVFYQIFPDRFANGDRGNDPYNVKKWEELPTVKGFHGGDLRGVIDHFAYLLDLGVNAIYFNPIFQAASTHRYDTYDYFKIDPKLGTLTDFHDLVAVAHQNNVHIVLDGVFNHCGRGFFAFHDILENGSESPYLNWFHIKKFPLDAYANGDAVNYLGWWKLKSLPKLNTDEPAVRQYLLDVARYWIEQGADGWRLDVPNEIDDDDFWFDFRSVVREANPEAYIVGEIWDGDPRWVGDRHFDGLMHYPIRDAVFDIIDQKISATDFADSVEGWLTKYPRENVNAMLVLLGSHDTKRLYRKMDGDWQKIMLASMFPFVYPGAPCVYYGDEIGMDGGSDPDCRRTFPWEEGKWHQTMRQWIQQLIRIRHERISLRRGDVQRIAVNEHGYAFCRNYNGEFTLVVMNFGDTETTLLLPCDLITFEKVNKLRDLITGDVITSDDNFNVTLAPWSGKLFGIEK